MWQHWTPHSVYWLDCSSDLTGDSVNDCLASGKSGLLCAVNGHDGSLLWKYRMPGPRNPDKLFDVYAGQFVKDVDGDGVVDILAAHTSDGLSGTGFIGHLVLISGNNGHLLRLVATPQNEEIYYAPQIIVQPDSQDIVLFGTGGQDTPGGVYAVTLQQLISGDLSQLKIIHHDVKGVMSPPVLADINSDGYEDIVVATFNSVVLAFDGLTFERLWNYTTPASETYSSPTPAYFNDDDIPDFLVKYQSGPGFPVYYYSQAAVLDGLTGSTVQKPLFESLASQSAGLTVSMEGLGNDLFLYWSGYCLGHEEATDAYNFSVGMSASNQRKADLCKLRYNATQSYKLWALNQHIPPPGFPVYSSESRRALEYNNSISPFLEAQRYMAAHPDFSDAYLQQQASPATQYEPATERPKEEEIEPDANRNIFRHRDQPLMNRNHNHYHADQTHSRDDYRGGEGEQMLPGYLNDGKYPNIRKHGDMSTNHPHNNHKWQAHHSHPVWQGNVDPNSYQDRLNADANVDEKLYENPNRELDYETQYEPRIVNGYIRQRDERSKTKGGTVGSGDNEGVLFKNYAPANEERWKLRARVRDNVAQKEPSSDMIEDPYVKNHGVRSRSRNRVSDNVAKRDVRESAYEARNVDGYARQGDDRSKTMGGDSSRTAKRDAPQTVSGTQRLSSTGTLVPPLFGGENSIDVIFATYWLPNVDDSPLTDTFRECIRKKLAQSQLDNGKYFGMDATAAISAGLGAECPVEDNRPSAEQNGDAAFDPTNVSLGQMTVYRLRVTCTCANLARTERCSKVLPFEKQSWPHFMGWNGKGYFKPRHR